MEKKENVFFSDGMGRVIVASQFLRGTKFEEWDRSDISNYIMDLIANLDPKFKDLTHDFQIAELIYQNKDDMELRLLIAAYLILNNVI